MLTGPELGAAIEAARIKKGITKKKLAADFNVAPPSIQDWVRRGTIDKEKLARLWVYFADVVGPEHWGLSGDAAPLLAVATGLGGPAPSDSVSLAVALKTVGTALATDLSDETRDEVATIMAELARRRGAERYQKLLLGLLERPAAAAIAAIATMPPPPAMKGKPPFATPLPTPGAGADIPEPAPEVKRTGRTRSDA